MTKPCMCSMERDVAKDGHETDCPARQSEAKRMSAERLVEIREIVAQNEHGISDTERRVGYPGQREFELLAHIAALEAELEEARATALEEAAQLIDQYAPERAHIAAAIRALKDQKP